MRDKRLLLVKVAIVFFVVASIVGAAWASWKVRRAVNYSWCYEDQVQEQIEKRVKPLEERLKALENK